MEEEEELEIKDLNESRLWSVTDKIRQIWMD